MFWCHLPIGSLCWRLPQFFSIHMLVLDVSTFSSSEPIGGLSRRRFDPIVILELPPELGITGRLVHSIDVQPWKIRNVPAPVSKDASYL